jgi:hypothetical protein
MSFLSVHPQFFPPLPASVLYARAWCPFGCCTFIQPSIHLLDRTPTHQEDVSLLMSQYSVNLVDEARDNHTQMIERAEIANLVRSRMESLNLPGIDYMDVSEKRNSLSYVIINPSCDLKLEEGDIM